MPPSAVQNRPIAPSTSSSGPVGEHRRSRRRVQPVEERLRRDLDRALPAARLRRMAAGRPRTAISAADQTAPRAASVRAPRRSPRPAAPRSGSSAPRSRRSPGGTRRGARGHRAHRPPSDETRKEGEERRSRARASRAACFIGWAWFPGARHIFGRAECAPSRAATASATAPAGSRWRTTNGARECECRRERVAAARAARLATSIPRRYLEVDFERWPITNLDQRIVREVTQVLPAHGGQPRERARALLLRRDRQRQDQPRDVRGEGGAARAPLAGDLLRPRAARADQRHLRGPLAGHLPRAARPARAASTSSCSRTSRWRSRTSGGSSSCTR